MKIFTREDVIGMLKRKQGHRTASAFAMELGVSAPYLADVYAGNRPPSHRILAAIGMRKEKTITVAYFELNGAK